MPCHASPSPLYRPLRVRYLGDDRAVRMCRFDRRAEIIGLITGFGIIAAVVAALCFLTGCNTAGDYYGDRTAIAAANAKAGGFAGITGTAPAVVAGAVKSAGFINGLGAVALLAGCVVLSQRDLNNGLGFGLALGGLCLLLAGFLLPVYGGWIGLGLLGALAAFYWDRARVPVATGAPAAPSFIDRLKSLFA